MPSALAPHTNPDVILSEAKDLCIALQRAGGCLARFLSEGQDFSRADGAGMRLGL